MKHVRNLKGRSNVRSVRFAPSVSESDWRALSAQLYSGARAGGHNKASNNDQNQPPHAITDAVSYSLQSY